MPAGPSTSSRSFSVGAQAVVQLRDIAVWALTSRGSDLARRIAAELGATLFLPEKYAAPSDEQPFQHFSSAFPKNFFRFRHHVCVAASGIVVRCVGPLLRDKTTDPGVVVLDQEGRHAVSLVGGHLGGANDMARKVARLTGGQAVITTATDTAGLPALDLLARELGLVADRPERFAPLAAALLAGEIVQVLDTEDYLWTRLREMGHGDLFERVPDVEAWRDDRPGVWVSWKRPLTRHFGEPARESAGEPAILGLHPRRLVAGLGCHRGVSEASIITFVREVFDKNDLALPSLSALGTVQARIAEPGLHSAAAALGADVTFFSPEQLQAVRTPNPSETAARLVGTKSVCEAAALLLARTDTLVVTKTKGVELTLAVALPAR
ncbi:cobalt-precorrin 5A hydrolase [Desulfonatronum sp. SC1]|uniref:cobalt-precorrin 5A hydrolase n=1 Tax=Desulfonatronum sp. SC1 TaxID=2109626 RepID=UPI000D2F657D|nr:cobalamin biosynthesis protein [Desulfonatronum sp. SC1]PTN33940.1 cobalamin biosynthesis protein CbiG [Desulfonatronum sp. SC1]